MRWLRDVLREAFRRRIGLRSGQKFLVGQARIRAASLWQEGCGALRDLAELRSPTRPLLVVSHSRQLEPDGTIVAGMRDLLVTLVGSSAATLVRSRLGYRLRSSRAIATFSSEPFTAAPPVRFDRRHRSAVFISDTWDKVWMARHLDRCRADHFLTGYLESVGHVPALGAIERSKWRLFPWWVADEVVDSHPDRGALEPKAVVVGAAGPMYDLRAWVAEHPLVAGYFRMSSYEKSATRVGSAAYFDLLAEQSGVVVAFSESEAMRIPIAKYVEVPAVGALLIAARAHHLAEMGFQDGLNCIIFEGRTDFERKLRPFLERPSDFIQVAAAGRALIASRHITSCRMAELLDLLGVSRPPSD